MKKIFSLMAALSLFAFAAFPVLAKPADMPPAPAEKATGEVWFTNYAGRDAYINFNAHELNTECSVSESWNYDGTWGLGFNSTKYPSGNPYAHSLVVTGGTATGSSTGNTYDATFTVDGNTVTIVATYKPGSAAYPYTYTAIGTVSGTGTISGTWNSTDGDSGNWFTASGAATKMYGYVGCDGKGELSYSDPLGGFTLDVMLVKVDGDYAWFAGPLTSNTHPHYDLSSWVVFKVYNGGTPATEGDDVWHQEVKASGGKTAQQVAQTMVANMGTPVGHAIHMDAGNLQVHTY